MRPEEHRAKSADEWSPRAVSGGFDTESSHGTDLEVESRICQAIRL